MSGVELTCEQIEISFADRPNLDLSETGMIVHAGAEDGYLTISNRTPIPCCRWSWARFRGFARPLSQRDCSSAAMS